MQKIGTIEREAAHLDMKRICNENGEAVELFNYLNNDARLNANKAREFRRFEYEMKWGDFVAKHCEARLMYIANEAAMKYCKEYGGNYREQFTLEQRRLCAAMMAAEFVIEIDAGNSWAG